MMSACESAHSEEIQYFGGESDRWRCVGRGIYPGNIRCVSSPITPKTHIICQALAFDTRRETNLPVETSRVVTGHEHYGAAAKKKKKI